MKYQRSSSLERGYVETLTGRRRPLTPILSGSRSRQAMNTPVQGMAADIMKFATARIDYCIEALSSPFISCAHLGISSSKKSKAFELLPLPQRDKPLRARMLLQIHDELLFEVHRDDVGQLSTVLKRIMVNCWRDIIVATGSWTRYAALISRLKNMEADGAPYLSYKRLRSVLSTTRSAPVIGNSPLTMSKALSLTITSVTVTVLVGRLLPRKQR